MSEPLSLASTIAVLIYGLSLFALATRDLRLIWAVKSAFLKTKDVQARSRVYHIDIGNFVREFRVLGVEGPECVDISYVNGKITVIDRGCVEPVIRIKVKVLVEGILGDYVVHCPIELRPG